MKNATRYCAGPQAFSLQDVLTDVYCSKQTGSSSTKGNHHPSFLRFWNWAEENCRCSQNLWRRRNVTNRNPANIRKWIARFYYFRHLYPLKRVCIAHTLYWVAHRYGQLYLHCSLIYFWVPSSCFCIVISLSEGEIIPFSGVCQSGEAALSTPRRWWLQCTDWQTALACNRRRPAATSSRRASFSALASANSSGILHRAQQHHADASACQ